MSDMSDFCRMFRIMSNADNIEIGFEYIHLTSILNILKTIRIRISILTYLTNTNTDNSDLQTSESPSVRGSTQEVLATGSKASTFTASPCRCHQMQVDIDRPCLDNGGNLN
jgi:hypothetical protein